MGCHHGVPRELSYMTQHLMKTLEAEKNNAKKYIRDTGFRAG
jgi:hypothetical protein